MNLRAFLLLFLFANLLIAEESPTSTSSGEDLPQLLDTRWRLVGIGDRRVTELSPPVTLEISRHRDAFFYFGAIGRIPYRGDCKVEGNELRFQRARINGGTGNLRGAGAEALGFLRRVDSYSIKERELILLEKGRELARYRTQTEP